MARSIRATVMPAARMNTAIMASVSTATSRVRRTMTYHLTRAWGEVPGTMELITKTGLERTRYGALARR